MTFKDLSKITARLEPNALVVASVLRGGKMCIRDSYETARSAPLNVTISPSLADSTLTAPQTPAAATAPAARSQNGLRPDHPAAQVFVHSLRCV